MGLFWIKVVRLCSSLILSNPFKLQLSRTSDMYMKLPRAVRNLDVLHTHMCFKVFWEGYFASFSSVLMLVDIVFATEIFTKSSLNTP